MTISNISFDPASLNTPQQNKRRVLRANWIWTGEGLPVSDGVISIEGDRIVLVDQWKNYKGKTLPIEDWGNCCLLPGLLNSHTHFEFSDLAKPIPPGDNFADWIVKVVQYRMLNAKSIDADRKVTAHERHRHGYEEAAQFGTALALNVVHGATSQTNPVHSSKSGSEVPLKSSVDGLAEAATPLHEIPFAELMATTDLRRQQTWRFARGMMRDCLEQSKSNGSLGMGLSPHAPYTTTAKLVRQTATRCRRFGLPLMMHLAETREELNWFITGDGPLEEMLEMMVGPLGLPTLDRLPMIGYVHEILRAPKALLIHGNYLDKESLNALATHRETATVVYCPRTHKHFGHDRYPLERMRDHGVRVLLGTDSRASNPDLNIWEEARHVWREYPSIPPEQIMQMITSDAATFLGLEKSFGFLRPNALAFINAVPCTTQSHTDQSPRSVLEDILSSDATILTHQSSACDLPSSTKLT